MSVVIGAAGLVLLAALVDFAERIGNRIAYGSGRRSTVSVDAISAAQYDRKRGDFSGLGGM
jgi:hypothetical protein